MPPGHPAQLPPLILHPFTGGDAANHLLEKSRESLLLLQIEPPDGSAERELCRQVLEARWLELRMLFFVGKDLFRWIGQCVESAESQARRGFGIGERSFAHLLVSRAPQHVREKLRTWGVGDPGTLFSRALGLHATFRRPPAAEELDDDFVLNYHRYADSLYLCWRRLRPFPEIGPEDFTFELYGSREYSRKLEQEWHGQ